VDSRSAETAIERVLDKQGRSIAWLARETGVSKASAWRMLKGERTVTAEFKSAASRVLGVPEDLLFPAPVSPA
jgi:transcriptional regulator with XRE-family HTH domain